MLWTMKQASKYTVAGGTECKCSYSYSPGVMLKRPSDNGTSRFLNTAVILYEVRSNIECVRGEIRSCSWGSV